VIVLHSLLEYPLWYGPFQMALGICLGLLWHPSAHRRCPVARPPAQHHLLIATHC
jgi:hypothetical protein